MENQWWCNKVWWSYEKYAKHKPNKTNIVSIRGVVRTSANAPSIDVQRCYLSHNPSAMVHHKDDDCSPSSSLDYIKKHLEW